MRDCIYTLLLTCLLTAEVSCGSAKHLDYNYHDYTRWHLPFYDGSYLLRPVKLACHPIEDPTEKNADRECARRCMIEKQSSKPRPECFQPLTWPPCETIDTIFL